MLISTIRSALHALATLAAVALLIACAPSEAERFGQETYQGRTVDEWFALVGDHDIGTSIAAKEAFRQMGPRAVPYLTAKLQDRDLGVQARAGSTLATMCRNAVPAMKEAQQHRTSRELDFAIEHVERSSGDPSRIAVCGP